MTMAIMFQGTGSDVGKSILVAGLCRALTARGFRVLPFKPQNMSNNAAVTKDGGEIGRAQALQAMACHAELSVDMNPVLLKPESDKGAQIIVHGKAVGTGDTSYYRKNKSELLKKVIESFDRLKNRADIVVVEGAGSPAETNLRANDIANMGFATATGTAVIIIGDIDRGGVIASLVGTHTLLCEEDRILIKGFIINKFRGDESLFDDALVTIIDQTSWQNIGILPFLTELKQLPAEDAVVLEKRYSDQGKSIHIVVPMFSRIANFDDLDPLSLEEAVLVEFIPPGTPLPLDADLIILPGTKSTLADLHFFRTQGWDIDLAAHIRRGGKVLGICGGYQMLGKTVSDPHGLEGLAEEVLGLGYLDIETTMQPVKEVGEISAYCDHLQCKTSGYEIHMGKTSGPDTKRSFLRDNKRSLGATSADGQIAGVYVHGLFADDEFRMKYLESFQSGRIEKTSYLQKIESSLDILAEKMEQHLDINAILENCTQKRMTGEQHDRH